MCCLISHNMRPAARNNHTESGRMKYAVAPEHVLEMHVLVEMHIYGHKQHFYLWKMENANC